MVRKVTSPLSDDSQKEPNGAGGQPSSEKMNGKSARRAGRVESDEEDQQEEHEDGRDNDATDDADGDVEEDDDDVGEDEGSSRGRKRARANSLGDSRPSQVDVKGKAKMEPKTLPRDEDGYIPGSIVRVQLRNFVTYDYVEFSPGPYLNMILGPNGTGKSSIACAICLGLNFPPSVLGRATELNSFVKIGTEEGHIEIELKGAKGKPNLVIRRTLSAKSKANQFTINGRSASGKDINSRMQELNVQVSNLCSFLPQDKVAEFARMTPQQLLRETQRAAGSANLTSWHDTLIEAGKEYKSMKERMDGDAAQLKNMEERNANLERDVKKYEERQKIEREIEFLELLLPIKEYEEVKKKYDESKALQRTLHKKINAIQKKNAPLFQKRDQLQAEQGTIDRKREEKKKAMRLKSDVMRRNWDENERLESQGEDLKTKLDSIKKEERNRQRQIETLKKEIAQIQHKIDNPPEFGNVEALAAELSALKTESRDLHSQLDDIQQRQRDTIDDQSKHKREVDMAQQRLQQLSNVDHQKLESLVRWHRDTGDTVRWLRQNRHRFKMPIFEPPMLSINVADKRYASAIEACFSQNDMQTFVAQCNEDYQLLNQLVADTPEALGRKGRINSWYRDPTSVNPPPVSREELQQLGFDGYAMDYIQFPEGMKYFLQSTLNLHRTAIALDPRKVDPSRAMEVLSRDGSVSYVVGNVMNQVRRSRYGRRLAQNSTREIQQARNLVATTVDPSVRQALERTIAENQEQIKHYDAQLETVQSEEGQLRKRFAENKKKQDAIAKQKRDVEKQISDFKTLSLRIKDKEKDLKRLLNAPSADVERAQLKNQIAHLAKKRISIVLDYKRVVREAIAEQMVMTRLGLQYLQTAVNKQAVQAIIDERETGLQKLMHDYTKANEDYKRYKEEAHDKLAISNEKLASVNPEARARFEEMDTSGEKDERPADEIHVELETLRNQLGMNNQTNAGVVEQFKKRQAEIATLKDTIEEREEKLKKVEDRIARTRALWEPALRDLVDSIGEKFSSAFDRIGCAGEIKIAEHEDFDKWAIDILVKFRDDEKLQLLTAERQSGGERSLTTILYLMSLTEHARAPFSLVDEINQGMDARAERAVHNSLVDVTCKADAGQYFLITPKLLPDLLYHERMKILCVNNGEWLPDDVSGNMMGLIDVYVQQHGQA